MRIVVCGDINADLHWDLAAYPAEGDDATARGLRWGSGGAGANMGAMLARLGARVRLVGRVGVDPAAAVALRCAETSGVDLSLVVRDPALATGLCSVAVAGDGAGQRTFFSFRGANPACTPDQLADEPAPGTALLLLSSHALLEDPQRATALEAVRRARARGVPVALDLGLPAIARARAVIDDLLPDLWLISANGDELAALRPDHDTEAALHDLRSRGVLHAAVKLGAAGGRLVSAAGDVAVVAPNVAVVDTTGCGDAFTAGLAWALVQGAPADQALAAANALGAATATRTGAADALPPADAIPALLPAALRGHPTRCPHAASLRKDTP
ncbi:MAG TPA: carbohydrate kinase family protein [Candidatus Krumholzibacteria bacterium]|nr:carbohydrate kinase family protein [Candidatus Krumholzibacteria bacterium]